MLCVEVPDICSLALYCVLLCCVALGASTFALFKDSEHEGIWKCRSEARGDGEGIRVV